MPTTAYQSAYTGTQIDDAVAAVQTAAFIDTDDGTGGLVETVTALSDLTDVSISSPSNNQGLIYDSTAGKWMNKAIPGGGGGGGEENVIEIVKVNGTALTPDSNKAVDVSVPTESTVSGWGFTKNTGTYSKPSGGIPATDLASAVQTSLGKADTALQSYTETDPTVPSWAKASSKPTYTASEVGALPDTTTIPTKLSELTSDSTHRVVTDTEKSTWNSKGTYSKPSGGIPASDIASGVIPTVPTNVSAFTNDANYVTSDNTVAVYSGSSAPSSSLGKNGDIYIQTS